MTQFYDSEIERIILKCLLNVPYYSRVPDLNTDFFHVDVHKQMFDVIRKFFIEYHKPLTVDVLDSFLSGLDVRDEIKTNVTLLHHELQILNVEVSQFDFYLERLEFFKTGRDIRILYENLGNELATRSPKFDKLLTNLTSTVMKLSSSSLSSDITRQFLWEDVKNRWDDYLFVENHPDELPGMSYGIKALNDITGGVRKTHVVLFYGKTGGGKSRLLTNIALNLAHEGHHVMYISLEMSRSLLIKCIDSRESLLDFTPLDKGKLDSEQKRKHFEQLKLQKDEKIPLYVVDAPTVMRPTDVGKELELYYHSFGKFPDVVVIDYANLMESSRSYTGGRSEKYDLIFQDLHLLCRYYDVGIITAAQERRGLPGKKSEKDSDGVDKVGLSNYMATHCEFVAHLHRDELDLIENTLQLDVDKNRYGRAGFSFSLFAAWAYNYIGDRHLKLDGKRIS